MAEDEDESSLIVPPGEKIIELIERDDDPEPVKKPAAKPVAKTATADDDVDDTPGWAHSLSDRMSALERRIPEPRAEADDTKIISIEEIKDAVEEKAPEVVHGLFRQWGKR